MTQHRGGALSRVAPEGCYTTSGFAMAVGISTDTAKRWRLKGTLIPSGEPQQSGELTVHIYTEEDVRIGRQLRVSPGSLDQRLANLEVAS